MILCICDVGVITELTGTSLNREKTQQNQKVIALMMISHLTADVRSLIKIYY